MVRLSACALGFDRLKKVKQLIHGPGQDHREIMCARRESLAKITVFHDETTKIVPVPLFRGAARPVVPGTWLRGRCALTRRGKFVICCLQPRRLVRKPWRGEAIPPALKLVGSWLEPPAQLRGFMPARLQAYNRCTRSAARVEEKQTLANPNASNVWLYYIIRLAHVRDQTV